VTTAAGFPLAPHNVFFSHHPYREEFKDIFRRQRLPLHPTVYIRAQDRDQSRAGNDNSRERIFGIINAPAVGDRIQFSEQQTEPCLSAAIDLIRRCGLEAGLTIADLSVTTPDLLHDLFPHSGGALYGNVTHSMWAPLRRTGARTKITGLYCTGGTTHPGAGVPMAAISGRQAAQAVLTDQHLGSLAPFSAKTRSSSSS